jgi:hypothetical protein
MYHLSQFEEAVGILHELIEEDDILIALVGKIYLVLPLNMKESLRPLIGMRTAILHTDLPGKQFLFRVFAREEGLNPRELESKPAIEGNGNADPIFSANVQGAIMLNRTERPGELVPPRARKHARFPQRNQGCINAII